MRTKDLFLAAGLSLLGAVVGLPSPVRAGEVIHVSAGIGDDDAIEVEMMRRLHNLQLIFAAQGSGSYLADVRVAIYDATEGKVLAAVSPGPLFFATLPSGRYRIEAEFRGRWLSRTTRIAPVGRRDLYFYWPSD
ncbi:carboxypeptidase regulatory-like domain-containing protein [Accumulibacter sp.]|uniref:carboxypeptidase regulatory-like domain-containing protein n=1 Tax=Accumulibacter sp. TaxID=2053492 RepID=UPI0026299662|nr:carboxypeptidase regulatory-like domain-containing protein [Accumulibacter sp.]